MKPLKLPTLPWIIPLTLIIFFLALSIWEPWQRQPVVFYQPLILPLETIKGDIIILQDGSHIEIEADKRINTLRVEPGSVTINATVHKTLGNYPLKASKYIF